MGEPGFVRNRGDKEAHARFPLGRAFACAGCGIRHAFATQRNMRIHAAVAVVAVVLGVVLGIDAPSWAAVVLCIAGVMAAECANTAIEAVVDEVLAANPDKVEQYRGGKTGLIGFFVGQCMKKTQGQGNPKVINELLAEKLG